MNFCHASPERIFFHISAAANKAKLGIGGTISIQTAADAEAAALIAKVTANARVNEATARVTAAESVAAAAKAASEAAILLYKTKAKIAITKASDAAAKKGMYI